MKDENVDVGEKKIAISKEDLTNELMSSYMKGYEDSTRDVFESLLSAMKTANVNYLSLADIEEMYSNS